MTPTELMPQLAPIAEILGAASVKASYSDYKVRDRLGDGHPGWAVEVNGSYKGTQLTFSTTAQTLDEAADAALKKLRGALGL